VINATGPLLPPSLRRGDRGPQVRVLRELLTRVRPVPPAPGGPVAAPPPPDTFDDDLERQVRAFQQHRGLMADGVVGPQTARVLDAARWRLGDRSLLFTPGHLMRGDDVAELQERLVVLGILDGPVDGAFGPRTDGALREVQRALGLQVDGHCGPATLRALGALGRAVRGGDPWALRQQAEVAVAGKSLAGRVVVIDPAHGGPGDGVDANGLRESDVVLDLAQRIEGRLSATGGTALLTRGPGTGRRVPDEAGRAAFAHQVGADILLSLHCDGHRTPVASGLSTFYWGDVRVGARSAVGERLATLIQRELVARTGLTNLDTHARTFDILRMTRMPAVRVELGYLTSPSDAAKLGDSGFRDVVADALVVAIQRLYLGDEDAATGTLRLDDVLAHAGRAVAGR
jgi:N-acetylmuramoyl-L-alanine amidase